MNINNWLTTHLPLLVYVVIERPPAKIMNQNMCGLIITSNSLIEIAFQGSYIYTNGLLSYN